MKLHEIQFKGGLLERGFWLYVWRVKCGDREALYVGRTGDSSSRYAASPFSRLSQHLDIRATANANTLLRNLRSNGFDHAACSFELFSVGPIFQEQPTLELHREHRDVIAPLETALAQHFKDNGHLVLGSHPRPRPYDQQVFSQVLDLIGDKLGTGANNSFKPNPLRGSA